MGKYERDYAAEAKGLEKIAICFLSVFIFVTLASPLFLLFFNKTFLIVMVAEVA